MAQEIYVDGVGNISIQGPVITLSFIRTSQGAKPEETKDHEVVKLTMTGQNLVKMTNILSNTLKRLAERNQEMQVKSDLSDSGKDQKNDLKEKKSKTVN